MDMDLEILKRLALFFVITIPGVMILTHLAAWIVRRLKGVPPPPRPWPTPAKSPYRSIEEFRRDAELLSVSDVLERMAGAEVPVNRALEERKRKAEEGKAADAAPAYCKDRPGNWYRWIDGGLIVLVDVKGCPKGFGRFLEIGTERPVLRPLSGVEPALPRAGEFWDCDPHCGTHTGGPFQCLHDGIDFPHVGLKVDCGCELKPVNFGKGPDGGRQPADIQARVLGFARTAVGGGGAGSLPNMGGWAGDPLSGGAGMGRK